jgi:hypothetical protein
MPCWLLLLIIQLHFHWDAPILFIFKHGSEPGCFFENSVPLALKFRDCSELDWWLDVIILLFEIFELLFKTFYDHFGWEILVWRPESFLGEIGKAWSFGFEGLLFEVFLQFDVFLFESADFGFKFHIFWWEEVVLFYEWSQLYVWAWDFIVVGLTFLGSCWFWIIVQGGFWRWIVFCVK